MSILRPHTIAHISVKEDIDSETLGIQVPHWNVSSLLVVEQVGLHAQTPQSAYNLFGVDSTRSYLAIVPYSLPLLKRLEVVGSVVWWMNSESKQVEFLRVASPVRRCGISRLSHGEALLEVITPQPCPCKTAHLIDQLQNERLKNCARVWRHMRGTCWCCR